MIATITPNMSNSEHSLNTLRYADRVKELKGATNYEEDDGEAGDLADETGIEADEEDENMKESEEELLLLDEEFPPENFGSDHHMDEDSDHAEAVPPKASQTTRTSLLSQVNKRPLLPRSDSDGSSAVNSNDSLELKGMATAINPRQEDASIQALIKLHRDHIRDCSDSGKLESRLLVNLNMKLAKTGGDRNAIHLAFDNYIRELDAITHQKMQKLEEFRSKIHQQNN